MRLMGSQLRKLMFVNTKNHAIAVTFFRLFTFVKKTLRIGVYNINKLGIFLV